MLLGCEVIQEMFEHSGRSAFARNVEMPAVPRWGEFERPWLHSRLVSISFVSAHQLSAFLFLKFKACLINLMKIIMLRCRVFKNAS